MVTFTTAEDGTKIAYAVAGDGPPIVLIHGFATDQQITWRNTQWFDTLTRARRQVIALDCRGHGASEKPHTPAEYDDRLMAKDVLAVMDALSIQVADIMGYSMGGYMTINIAHEFPARVRRAIVGGVGATYFHFWQERNETIAQALLAPDPATITDPLGREFREFGERAGNDMIALTACMRRPRLSFTSAELGDIAAPVLVVCGEEDTIAGRPEPLARHFKTGRAVAIPRRNHHSTVGDRTYKDAVRAFLDEEI